MKKLILLILFFSQFSFSQKVIVSNPINNNLYLEVFNPLEIYVEGFKCTDIKIEIDNGFINGRGCSYNIKPSVIGNLKIKIFNKKHKLIAEQSLNVINLKPIAKLKAPQTKSGELILERASGISAEIEGVDIVIDDSKIEYDLFIIRNDKVIYKKHFIGKIFNEELKSKLQDIFEDDLVLVTNVGITINAQFYKLNDIVIKN